MQNNGSDESKDMLYIVGGLALLVAGAGLLLSHPNIRRQVRAGLERVLPNVPTSLTSGLTNVVPDIQRYMRIRSM